MAANTKGAMRALYASKDELFDRLNLAFHAIEIKSRRKYDVPLLIMSQDKPPYHYTEAMIKADLLTAYKLLKEGAFPYDRSMHIAFEKDPVTGEVVLDAKAAKVTIKDADGSDLKVPKNMEYQQNLLVNLFKMGFGDLANLDAIEHGAIDEASAEAAVSTIVQKMGVMGGLSREQQLMEKTFAVGDVKKKEDFFLRAAALGHQSLVESMLARDDFKITIPLLEKAIQFAHKNKHEAVEILLNSVRVAMKQEKSVFTLLDRLNAPLRVEDPMADRQERIRVLVEASRRYEELSKLSKLPALELRIKQAGSQLLLNDVSRNPVNEDQLPALLKLLAANETYIENFPYVVASKQNFNIPDMIGFHQKQGADNTSKIMRLFEFPDVKIRSRYLSLIPGHQDKAQRYFDYVIGHKDNIRNQDELLGHVTVDCRALISTIKAPSSKLENQELYKLILVKEPLVNVLTRDAAGLIDVLHEFTQMQGLVVAEKSAQTERAAAEQQRAAEQALQVEQQRVAAEQALQAEQQRAAEQATKDEAATEVRKTDCLKYVDEIENAGWGPGDLKTVDFCNAMRAKINLTTDPNEFEDIMKELKVAHESATSPEICAVKEKFEQFAKGWGWNYKDKAKKILDAVCHVELTDRLNIFSAKNNPACNQVRQALAWHRHPFHSSQKAGEVDAKNAANTFIEMPKAIAKFNAMKSSHKELRAEEEVDNTDRHNLKKG